MRGFTAADLGQQQTHKPLQIMLNIICLCNRKNSVFALTKTLKELNLGNYQELRLQPTCSEHYATRIKTT